MTYDIPLKRFPANRLRRLRKTPEIRSMVREFSVTADDLVMPYFIIEGVNQRQEIASMPHIARLSLDLLLQELAVLIPLGLKSIAIFPVTPNDKKDDSGHYALDPDNLICRAIKAIKAQFPQLLIIADVALDPYTSHGHDGVLDQQGYMQNDETLNILTQQALNQVHAGADIIAPSDMCDGRVGAIRGLLEAHGFVNIIIMAYSAKYASGFYGPFRDAVCSSNHLDGDKKNYQMDYANKQEALNEIAMDIQEGADIVIIKPAMLYLDIIHQATQHFSTPICAYQVSGEYAMIDFAANQNFASRQALINESLIAFKRAGCQMIISYFTKELLQNIF